MGGIGHVALVYTWGSVGLVLGCGVEGPIPRRVDRDLGGVGSNVVVSVWCV